MEFLTYREIIKGLRIGKSLPGSIYIHVSNFTVLPISLTNLTFDTANNFNISDPIQKMRIDEENAVTKGSIIMNTVD